MNIKHFAVNLFVWFCSLILAGSLSGSDKGAELEAWTGKHTRVAWIQDQGDGSDTFGRGKKLMLYGFDSRDGKGERPIVPNVGNLFKPLFTPDGKHIIVSNRRAREMYMIEWETGHVQKLGAGVAVAVWEDPKAEGFFKKKNTTWIYYFAGRKPENKYGSSQPLYRFPLNKSGKKELIWDKTNMAWSNLQLSRDGKILGGLFPWPHGGFLTLDDKKFTRLGRGCWTSFSPDNSKLLWIFDGLHRNIQVHDIEAGNNWKVNINGAPGIGNFEVYHPRWSNHPNYFVMTGPYEKGEGGNRIKGGGEKVEVYIGRFDSKVRSVEDWFQVTSNKKADFYPAMWVAGGETVELGDLKNGETVSKRSTNWPGKQKNLVFVWENMKAANQLSENSPVGFFQCNVELRGRALHNNRLQLSLAGGYGDAVEAAEKITSGLAKSGLFSVELAATPGRLQDASLMSLSNGGKIVLGLEQKGADLVVRSVANKQVVQFSNIFQANTTSHVVVTFDGKNVGLFKNGRSKEAKTFAVALKKIQADSLLIGDKKGIWQGTLDSIALYNSVLSTQEAAQNYSMISTGRNAEVDVGTVIVEGTLLESTEIPAPDAIGAYRRALVVNSYSVDKLIEGKYEQDKIVVAEWAVLDRVIVKKYSDTPKSEQLVLHKFSDHPELEGERQMMDIFEPDLEMYYRLP